MRRALLAGAWLLAAGVAQAADPDWQKTLSPVQPGAFAGPRPFRAFYVFGWGKVQGGAASFTFRPGAPGEARLEARGGTTGFVRTLWKMDAVHLARADAPSLHPIALEQTEQYRSETVETRLKFTLQEVVKQQRELPRDVEFSKPKTWAFPDLLDLHSALLMVRSQPLRPGDTLRYVVYPSTSPFLAEITVVGTEQLTVAAGTFPALKLRLRLQKVGKKMVLEPHKKFSSGTVWVSDDADRMLLRVAVEIFVGRVWGELQKVEYLPEQ